MIPLEHMEYTRGYDQKTERISAVDMKYCDNRNGIFLIEHHHTSPIFHGQLVVIVPRIE